MAQQDRWRTDDRFRDDRFGEDQRERDFRDRDSSFDYPRGGQYRSDFEDRGSDYGRGNSFGSGSGSGQGRDFTYGGGATGAGGGFGAEPGYRGGGGGGFGSRDFERGSSRGGGGYASSMGGGDWESSGGYRGGGGSAGSDWDRAYGSGGYSGARSGGNQWRGGGGFTGGYGQNTGRWDWSQSGRDNVNRGAGWRSGQDYGRNDERGFWDRASDEVSSWFGDEEAERRRRMDEFRGRGPKGYTRSDDRIREDVSDRLTDDWRVDATDIEIAVSSGEVTLSGTVDSRDAKRRAEDLAETISGVKNVQNNLRVKDFGSTTSATGTESFGGSGSNMSQNKIRKTAT